MERKFHIKYSGTVKQLMSYSFEDKTFIQLINNGSPNSKFLGKSSHTETIMDLEAYGEWASIRFIYYGGCKYMAKVEE